MKKSSILALAVAPLILGASMAVQAQSVSTDPVGFVKTELPAGKLTPLGINLLKPAVASGKVVSVDGDTVTLSAEVSLDTGTSYYLEVADGVLEGDRIDVTSAAGDVVTLNLSASHNTLDSNALEVDSRILVRPHFTFKDITSLIGEDNLYTGSDIPDTDQVLVYESGGFITHGYFEGVWYDGQFNEVNDKILPPGSGFLFRRQGEESVQFTPLGEVRANDFVLPLNAGLQMISLGYPVDRSPASFDMTTDYFTGAELDFSEGDQILTHTDGGFVAHALFSDNEWYNGQFDTVTNENLFKADGTVLVRMHVADPDFRIVKPY